MSTKFISKNSNYMIVLKPGVEGNRALGTHSIPGLYIKFQDGVVDIKDDAHKELLRAHPAFGTDFVEVKEAEVDPFLDTRTDIEPQHVTTEIVYGHAGKKEGTPKMKMTPQLKKIIQDEAVKMIPEFLKANPLVLKEILSDLVKPAKEEKEEKEEDLDIPVTDELPDLEETTRELEKEVDTQKKTVKKRNTKKGKKA